jgi:hypothetical protein
LARRVPYVATRAGNKEIDMLTLLIALIVLLVLFGGVGYGYRDRWGGYYTGGTSLLGLIVVVLLVLFVLGALR